VVFSICIIDLDDMIVKNVGVYTLMMLYYFEM
jgi:hypothetical protein